MKSVSTLTAAAMLTALVALALLGFAQQMIRIAIDANTDDQVGQSLVHNLKELLSRRRFSATATTIRTALC